MARSQSKVIRAAWVVDNPNLVASLPYLNFLRFLKRNFFRRTNLRRLLQEGLVRWNALSDAKKSESWPVWLAGEGINDAADYFAVIGMAKRDVVQCVGPSTTSVLHRDAAGASRE
ncbi:uncharacterized protein LOC120450615 isoform X2 [Drosophila santomea]|uniref:uncharacterized protein LOC120450615 isoform X2 n=1 Tax=Drosophila santomea TaxID=129105 RepID=UPI00195363DA|nr:uncharacterized protein LOC120450615 isoform X2 [Drosophila santomea]